MFLALYRSLIFIIIFTLATTNLAFSKKLNSIDTKVNKVILNKFHEFLNNPNKAKKWIKKNQITPHRDRHLFNTDISRIDKKTLSKITIAYHGNLKYTMTNPLSTKVTPFDFSNINSGHIIIDNRKISLEKAMSYGELKKFFISRYKNKKTSLIDFVITPAYALGFIEAILLTAAGGYILLLAVSTAETLLDPSERRSLIRNYLNSLLENTLNECKKDKAKILSLIDKNSLIPSMDVLSFINQVQLIMQSQEDHNERVVERFKNFPAMRLLFNDANTIKLLESRNLSIALSSSNCKMIIQSYGFSYNRPSSIDSKICFNTIDLSRCLQNVKDLTAGKVKETDHSDIIKDSQYNKFIEEFTGRKNVLN